MSRPAYSEKELEIIGYYPATASVRGGAALSSAPIYNTPVTPKENLKLLFSGAKPYWIPRAGFGSVEVTNFRPRMHPDNVATHLIVDGEAPMEFPSNIFRSSFFDLDWEFVDSAGGATVHPGSPKVTDINRWEDFVSIPDLGLLDWEGCAKANEVFLNTSKFNQLAILSGFWERLISIMDVEYAAVSLIDDEQKEGVHRFFDRLADMHIDYVRRMKAIFPLDGVLIHDDWGHQTSTFFSLSTCREMLVPYLKRLIDAVHEMGMSFELHSCGKNQSLVPAMIEAGVDLWCPQPMNDFAFLTQTYPNNGIAFGVPETALPEDATDEQAREAGRIWVDTYKDFCVVGNFRTAPPAFSEAVYEFSRRAFADKA